MRRRWIAPSAVVWIIVAAAFFLIPLVATLLFSLRSIQTNKCCSANAYSLIIHDHQFWVTIRLSFVLSLETIVISLLLFVPTIYWVHLKLPRLRPVLGFLAMAGSIFQGNHRAHARQQVAHFRDIGDVHVLDGEWNTSGDQFVDHLVAMRVQAVQHRKIFPGATELFFLLLDHRHHVGALYFLVGECNVDRQAFQLSTFVPGVLFARRN